MDPNKIVYTNAYNEDENVISCIFLDNPMDHRSWTSTFNNLNDHRSWVKHYDENGNQLSLICGCNPKSKDSWQEQPA